MRSLKHSRTTPLTHRDSLACPMLTPIRVGDREVDLFEVEVTHPLPVHTLRDIAKLWFELDALAIQRAWPRRRLR